MRDISLKLFTLTVVVLPVLVSAGGFSQEAMESVSSQATTDYCSAAFLTSMSSGAVSGSSWIASLTKADADSNGYLTEMEAQSVDEVFKAFHSMDENKDGRVSQLEAQRFTARMILNDYASKFVRADLDRDGLINSKEASRLGSYGQRSTVFLTYDADSDKKLSFDEYMNWRTVEDKLDLKGVFKKLNLSQK